MPTELTFFIVAAVAANLLIIGVLLALPRDRGSEAARDLARVRVEVEPADKYGPDELGMAASLDQRDASAAYTRVLRVLWWVTIAAVLVGVGLSGAYPTTQPLIYAVGGVAVVAVILLHELIPGRWRTPGRFWIEALLAIALVTAIMALTGFGSSPFFFGYALVAVAVALARDGRATYLFSAIASLFYVAVLSFDPARAGFEGGDLLRFGLNIGSLWLLAFLAGVYAKHERRSRSSALQMSQTDPLTGLFNRAQLYPTLDQEIRRTRRSERGFCVLMIDLDGLKTINDTLGHHRGDDVLRGLGVVIRRCIRTVDTAYRHGGDEFLILLPETDFIGAFVVAEKIRTGAEELSMSSGREGLDATVSIGLVSHPEDGSTVEELMIAADRAMYQAKSQGKNQISGYPRPRRLATPLPAPVEAAPSPQPAEPSATTVAEEAPAAATAEVGEPEVVAVAREVRVEAPEPRLRPVEMAAPRTNGVRSANEPSDESEPDASEVRRQIAAASRSFDPDHQIRRAMDAFLSPTTTRHDEPEH